MIDTLVDAVDVATIVVELAISEVIDVVDVSAKSPIGNEKSTHDTYRRTYFDFKDIYG
jgi:hypothetical protein